MNSLFLSTGVLFFEFVHFLSGLCFVWGVVSKNFAVFRLGGTLKLGFGGGWGLWVFGLVRRLANSLVETILSKELCLLAAKFPATRQGARELSKD